MGPLLQLVRTVRRLLRNWYRLTRARKFYSADAQTGSSADTFQRSMGKDALLVVIAFNNPHLVELQIASLNRFYRDSYWFVVVDNSSDASARTELQQLCSDSHVGYISLPPNPGTSPSESHGLALNWSYRHLAKACSTEYFGFLDHDIYPIRDVSYLRIIRRQGPYGRAQHIGPKWYYWPGFVFFRHDFFGTRQANFLPHSGLNAGPAIGDTGASNWYSHYSHLDIAEMAFPDEQYVLASGGRPVNSLPPDAEKQRDYFELFDGSWIHLVNGSNWKAVDMAAKLDHLEEYLT